MEANKPTENRDQSAPFDIHDPTFQRADLPRRWCLDELASPPPTPKELDDVEGFAWRLFVYVGTEATRNGGKQGASVFVPPAALGPWVDRHPLQYEMRKFGILSYTRRRNKCVIPLHLEIVGGVYWLFVNDEGTTRHGGDAAPVYLGRLDSQEVLSQLQAEDQAARRSLQTIRDDDKDRRRNLVRERMEPIRMAYRRMKPRQRAQLLADILQYMEVGTTDEKSTRW